MNFPTGSSVTKIIYGGLSFLALFSLLWCYKLFPSNFLRRITFIPKQENDKVKTLEEENKKDEIIQSSAEKTVKFSKNEGVSVVIEDDDANEDEEEEEEDEEDENKEVEEEAKDVNLEALKALEESFESASRLAYKYFAGGNYAKAVEKYSEAIELAAQVPSASSQIISLYNNRSAMFEKCGRYEESLGDIQILLAINPAHVKARSRRARINCIQGRKKEALFDFVFCQTMERLESNGQAPLNPVNVKEIEDLTRSIASEEGRKIFEKVRQSRRTFPGKAYCRNYLDSFPSIHYWRTILHKNDREEVQKELTTTGGYFNSTDFDGVTSVTTSECSEEDIVRRVESVIRSIWYEILYGTASSTTGASITGTTSSMQLAFKIVSDTKAAMFNYQQAAPDTNTFSKKWNIIFARLLQLQAIEYCLLSDLETAEETIRSALILCPITSTTTEQNVNDTTTDKAGEVSETSEEKVEAVGASNGNSNSSAESLDISFSACAYESILILCSILIEQSSTGKEPDEVVILLSLANAAANKLLPKDELEQQKEEVVEGEKDGDETEDEEEAEGEQEVVTKKGKIRSAVVEEHYLRKAWIALHTASYHIRKNEKGWYRSDCLTPAMTEIKYCLDITESPSTTVMKAVRLIALKKAVDITFFVQSMVKAQSGSFGDKNTTEEIATAKEWVADAWLLAQDIAKSSDGTGTGTTTSMCTVLMLESELMMNSGDLEAAILLSERAVTLADPDDAVPLVSKGNVVLQKTLIDLQTAQDRGDQEAFAQFPSLLNNAKELFEKALEIEPNGLDALAQLGQYYSLIGDLSNAMSTLQLALEHVRTLAEAVDLSQIYLSTSAQAAAVKELQPPPPAAATTSH